MEIAATRAAGGEVSDIIARLNATLANTPPEDFERLELCRCLRDAAATITSLRTEVRTLRQEVAALREERRMLIDADLPPGVK